MVRKYLFVLSVVQNLFFGFSCSLISKKQNKFAHAIVKKKNFCMISPCSPVFSELFFPPSFLQFVVLNSFVETCHSFCLSLVSFFVLCVFLSFSLPFVLFLVVYILFVNIVFSESSSFKCVSFPSFFDSLFDPIVLRNNYCCLSSVISFFLVLFLVHHFLFPPTKLFSLFHSVRLFLFLNKNYLFFSVVVSSMLTTSWTPFSVFVSFSLSFFFLRVFLILFVCLSYFFLLYGFLYFFSVPFFYIFSLLFITLILLLLLLDLFSFLFDNTFFDSLSLFFFLLPFSISHFFSSCFSHGFCLLLGFFYLRFFTSFFHNCLLCSLWFIFWWAHFVLFRFVVPYGCDGFRSFFLSTFASPVFFVFSTFLNKKKPSFWRVWRFFAIPFLSIFEKRMPWFSKMFWKFRIVFHISLLCKILVPPIFHFFYVWEISPLCFWTLFLVNFLIFLFLRFYSRFRFLFWWIFHFVHFVIQTKKSSCFSQF